MRIKWLLDNNVLFAAVWNSHADHKQARAWLDKAKPDGWGVTVETYLGAIRLLMNPRAMKTMALKSSEAVQAVRREFSGEHAGMIVGNSEPNDAFLKKAQGHGQIMDFYLAQMASETGAKLVTFDGGLLAAFPALTTPPV